ncbi:leucine-rich repeat-containing protein 34 isoform X4 [Ovis aries]|uniref:Leucine rich repeat containing 34 n=1 Tax=Ovis aries TaxID=9940 RepID=A0AC11ESL5_SHEEP|nr:leucine-rich repeat-containing protein 34 isoform X4 [Ovis aries]
MVNKESPPHWRSLPAQPGLRDRGGNGRGSHSMGAYDREVGPHLLQLFGCSTRSRSTRVVVMTTPPLPAGLYGAWSSARSRPGRRPGPHFPLPLRPRLRLGLRQTVAKNRTLKHLRMTGNKIENKGGMFFAAMLQINSSLEKLDLGDCDLGMQSVIAFATVLTQNRTIKGLNLNRPILYGEQEESTVHLGHMLKENQCLVELHMCKHDIKNCGMKQLCDALYLNRSLQYLDVSCNKITQDGMKCLADVLKSNTTLEVIDLSFNRMENAGANYLSDALASHNRTLKALSVVSNNIEGKGLVALSQSMKTNPTLSHIYIWGNKFDEATCVAYSDLIHTGRLKSDNTDVEPFVVDGHVYLAEVSNGLKRHYYWTPGYGEACSLSSNAGFFLAPVGQHL